MENKAETISDQEVANAASIGAQHLAPKVVGEILEEFGVGKVADLDQDQRREFVGLIMGLINGEIGESGEIEALDALPKSVRKLEERYDGLEWHKLRLRLRRRTVIGLDGDGKYLFVRVNHDPDVTPPTNVPYIVQGTGEAIYFMVPVDTDLPVQLAEGAAPTLGGNGSINLSNVRAFDPPDTYWPTGAEIVAAIETYAAGVDDARNAREAKEHSERQVHQAKELLERERQSYSGLYASAARIDEETPMLIEGLMRERGVSVFYGAFDEFKTTLVLDMVAHVAMGAPWQGGRMLQPSEETAP